MSVVECSLQLSGSLFNSANKHYIWESCRFAYSLHPNNSTFIYRGCVLYTSAYCTQPNSSVVSHVYTVYGCAVYLWYEIEFNVLSVFLKLSKVHYCHV